MKHFALLCFAVLFLAAGCISYQYEGVREAEPTTHVKVYTDATRIRQPYRVLGQATASGDSQDVSRDRLLAKLESEAEKSGADAILITEQQVVPGEIQKHFQWKRGYDPGAAGKGREETGGRGERSERRGVCFPAGS